MKTINMITQENVQFTLFPDNQPHVDLQNIEPGEIVEVKCRIASSLDMMHLLQISDALDRIGARKEKLTIYYLMGARYDRSMRTGDSVDLEVVANLINLCAFKGVFVFEPHNLERTYHLIKGFYLINSKPLVQSYTRENAVLIVPDKGAVKHVEDYLKWNPYLTEVCYCYKNRELDTGKLSLNVINPETCKDRHCVIIDDLCDGGGTFLAIAKQINPFTLTLIVSHGVFSKGTRILLDHFNHIITTDSFKYQDESPRVSVHRFNPINEYKSTSIN